MTTQPPERLVAEAVRSLEVRWTFSGQLEAAMAGWFGHQSAGNANAGFACGWCPGGGATAIEIRYHSPNAITLMAQITPPEWGRRWRGEAP